MNFGTRLAANSCFGMCLQLTIYVEWCKRKLSVSLLYFIHTFTYVYLQKQKSFCNFHLPQSGSPASQPIYLIVMGAWKPLTRVTNIICFYVYFSFVQIRCRKISIKILFTYLNRTFDDVRHIITVLATKVHLPVKRKTHHSLPINLQNTFQLIY